jgi:hypothetical protein
MLRGILLSLLILSGCDSEGAACPISLTLCYDKCVNTENDNDNCGGCGVVCDTALSLVCQVGVCVCIPSLTDCNGHCVDTSTNPLNCGACGNVCPTGETCVGGQCT